MLGVFFVLMLQIGEKPFYLHTYLSKNTENDQKCLHFNEFSIFLINLNANNE